MEDIITIPLRVSVDDHSLQLVGSIKEFLAYDGSCYCEILPRIEKPDAHTGFVETLEAEVAIPDIYRRPTTYLPVHLFKVKNAFFLPAYGIVISETGDLFRIPSAEARSDSADLLKIPGISIAPDGTYSFEVKRDIPICGPVAVTMPWGALVNYGHFILDALSSAALMLDNNIHYSHTLAVPLFNKWHLSHWNLLGVSPMQFDHTTHRSTEVVYTTCMDHFLQRPHLNYNSLRARQLDNFASDGSATPKKLYLSRKEQYRVMTNESELRSRLISDGFSIIDPGSISVEDQINHFTHAEIVVGAAGAGFANVLYCRPGTIVAEIVPQGMESQWVHYIAFLSGLKLLTYLCPALEASPTHPQHHLRFKIDVDRFMNSLAIHSK